MFRIGRRKTQRNSPLDHQFAQPEGNIGNTVFGFFVPDGVEVQRPRHSREGREIVSVLLRTANLLYHDRHLLIGQAVRAGLDIGSAGAVVDRGIDPLDGLADHTNHLLLVVHPRHHISGVDACKGLEVGILQFGTRPHGQRTLHVAQKDPQVLQQLLGHPRPGELRQNVRIIHILALEVLQPVEGDKPVEMVRGQHQRPRNGDPHSVPLVVELVLLEHIVDKGQPAGLAPERPAAAACKTDELVVGLGHKLRHHSLSHLPPIPPYGTQDKLPHLLGAVKLAVGHRPQHVSQRKEPPRIHPFREHVARRIVGQNVNRNTLDGLLHLPQVTHTRQLGPVQRVEKEKITESHAAVDEVSQLAQQVLRFFVDKIRPQLRRIAPMVVVGGLQYDGHRRAVAQHMSAQLQPRPRINLAQPLMAAKRHIRNNPQQIVLVEFIVAECLVIRTGKQNLGSRPFAQCALPFVQRLAHKFVALLDDNSIEVGQIGRVEPHIVLHQQNRLHADAQNILAGIHAVLEHLDNGQYQVGIPLPAEHIVDGRHIGIHHPPRHLAREGTHQNKRRAGPQLPHPVRESKDIHLANVEHTDNQVEMRIPPQQLHRLKTRAGPRKGWRIGQAQVTVLPHNLRLDMPVLLQRKLVVGTAHQQHMLDTLLHEVVEIDVHIEFLAVFRHFIANFAQMVRMPAPRPSSVKLGKYGEIYSSRSENPRRSACFYPHGRRHLSRRPDVGSTPGQ